MSPRLRVRYWVAVMSKDQVSDAIKKGYCEFKNGSKLPFKQVNPDSWFVYYSPGTKSLKEIREEGKEIGERVQAFTAIGQVLPGEPYSIDLGNDNVVYRRHARYVPNTTDAPIFPLMGKLSIFKSLSKYELWGIPLRKGLVEVLKSDFFMLCEAMNIDMPKRHNRIFEQSNVNIKTPEEPEEIHHLPLSDVNEPACDINKGNSTMENQQSIDPSGDNIENIVMDGLQQNQEMNGVLKVQSNDVNETKNSIQNAVDEGGTSLDPIQDNVQESKAKVAHQQQENDHIDRENNTSVEKSQQ